MKPLWALFIAMQVLSAGHINYQQELGYNEINPIYDRHPPKERVYMVKAAEILGVYAMTKIFPGHEDKILLGCIAVTVGFIMSDRKNGIAVKFRF